MTQTLTGWPSKIIETLIDKVYDIIDDPSIQHFYIGRSNDPNNRSYASNGIQKPDDIYVVYQTDRPSNAFEVEDTLIKLFHDDPKNINIATGAGGRINPEDVQYVYVAIWR